MWWWWWWGGGGGGGGYQGSGTRHPQYAHESRRTSAAVSSERKRCSSHTTPSSQAPPNAQSSILTFSPGCKYSDWEHGLPPRSNLDLAPPRRCISRLDSDCPSTSPARDGSGHCTQFFFSRPRDENSAIISIPLAKRGVAPVKAGCVRIRPVRPMAHPAQAIQVTVVEANDPLHIRQRRRTLEAAESCHEPG